MIVDNEFLDTLESNLRNIVPTENDYFGLSNDWKKYLDGKVDFANDLCDSVNNLLAEDETQIIDNIDDVSDGYHTFDDLYYQRLILWAFIVNSNPDICWKTHKHEDGESCFGGGWFLVTAETPEGAYGYHYKDEYWNLFNCRELDKAKHWDGYTEKDITRLFSLLKR